MLFRDDDDVDDYIGERLTLGGETESTVGVLGAGFAGISPPFLGPERAVVGEDGLLFVFVFLFFAAEICG